MYGFAIQILVTFLNNIKSEVKAYLFIKFTYEQIIFSGSESLFGFSVDETTVV